MNPDEPIVEVQRAATVQDIVTDHINGLGGYEIATKYGLDSERVKQIIADADVRLAFVPPDEQGNIIAPVDSLSDSVIKPLEEGENPEPGKVKGHK